MRTTGRSPHAGVKVNGNLRARLSKLTDKKFPKIPAIAITAAAAALFILSVTVIAVTLFGAKQDPVLAADIHIGADDGASATVGGVGRFPADGTNPDAPPTQTDSDKKGGRYTVTFAFHGKDSITCSLSKKLTMGEIAERLGIVFDESDVPNISADTVLSEDTVVTTDEVVYITDIVRTQIPFTTRYVDDSTIYRGNTQVYRYGQNGESVTEYEVKYVNGEEVSRREIKTYTSKEAVEQVILNGTKVYTPPSNDVVQNGDINGGTIIGGDGKTYKYITYIDVSATIYYPGGLCANGMPAEEGVIAVDPRVVALGTKVYVTGEYADIGFRIAADTGGDIKGNLIDICMEPTNPLAYNFGWRPMRLYILE